MNKSSLLITLLMVLLIVSCSKLSSIPSPTPSPVQGSVIFDERFGSVPMQPGGLLQMSALFEASSSQGKVIEMRALAASSCQDEATLEIIPWESFKVQKEFNAYNAHQWKNFAVTAQFRDDKQNLSPVYCATLPVSSP